MRKHKGFGLIEVLLATVLLVGIVSMLMSAFSTKTENINSKASGNQNAAILNDIYKTVQHYVDKCNNSSSSSSNSCTILQNSSGDYTDITAEDFLGLTSDETSNLEAQGVYPDDITITMYIEFYQTKSL